MTKKAETWLLDDSNVSDFPLSHDCEIKEIREEDDYLIMWEEE